VAVLNQFVFLDYLIVLDLIGFAVVGLMRGFSKTAAGTVGVLASLIGAIIVSGTLTPQLTVCLKHTIAAQLEAQIAADLPAGTESMASQITSNVMGILQDSIIKTVLFTIIFLLILAIWLYACNYLDIASKFPAAKKGDQLFGLVLGLLKGIIVILIIVYILRHMGILSETTLHSSILIQRVESLFHIAL
jgi:uncharacterized membrane protein required for colicin V production